MKKIIFFLLFFPIFLFSGVFEYLLNKDKEYLFEHNFRCHNSKCIASEKNVFNDKLIDNSVKIIKTFLDHREKVYKIEIELSIYNEKKEAFYNALLQSSDKDMQIEYKTYVINDKYGNHHFIDIIDKKKQANYIKILTAKYYDIMKSNKN